MNKYVHWFGIILIGVGTAMAGFHVYDFHTREIGWTAVLLIFILTTMWSIIGFLLNNNQTKE